MTASGTVQLITYADRLGGDLPGLARLLRSEAFAGAFGGVHVLPFFTPYDGADAGFDPVDHTAVDPRLGTWDDVRDLSRTHDVVVDLIVNHVSADSPQFRDVLARGEESPSYPMFLTMSSVFPEGAQEDDLARIYRPRPGLPFTALRLGDRLRYVWTLHTAADRHRRALRTRPGLPRLDPRRGRAGGGAARASRRGRIRGEDARHHELHDT
jgi:sucrose phosphorylase